VNTLWSRSSSSYGDENRNAFSARLGVSSIRDKMNIYYVGPVTLASRWKLTLIPRLSSSPRNPLTRSIWKLRQVKQCQCLSLCGMDTLEKLGPQDTYGNNLSGVIHKRYRPDFDHFLPPPPLSLHYRAIAPSPWPPGVLPTVDPPPCVNVVFEWPLSPYWLQGT